MVLSRRPCRQRPEDDAMSPHSDPDLAPDDEKSKSQSKREMTALQELGAALVDLSTHELDRITLPEKLRDAVMAARSIAQRGARKRQLQYIGRIMREVDAAPIREQLAELQSRSRQSAARLHHLERLRDRLLEIGDAALQEVVETFPNADRTHVRQLVREALKEKQQNKPPRAARTLFRYLRRLQDGETSLPE